MDVLSCIFSGTVAGLLPIGFLMWFLIKKRRFILPYLAGMFTFFLFQFLLRIPILDYLGTKAWFVSFFRSHVWLYGLFLAPTAGIFEEVGRFMVMKCVLRRRRDVYSGLVFGVGHWGIEALLVCGIHAWLSLFLYGGSFTVGPSFMFAGGLERLIVLPGHVAMTMMVYKGIVYRKPACIFLAVFVHMALDFTIVPAQVFGLEVWTVEGVLFLLNMVLLVYTVWTIKHWKAEKIRDYIMEERER